MDCGVPIFFHHPLGDKNGILKVVTIPGHEGHQHILAQCQLTHIRRRTIGQYVTTRHHVTGFHQRLLIDTGILVGTGVFGQIINIHTRLTRSGFIIIDTHHNTTGIHHIHLTATRGDNSNTRIDGNNALNTSTHQRLVST